MPMSAATLVTMIYPAWSSATVLEEQMSCAFLYHTCQSWASVLDTFGHFKCFQMFKHLYPAPTSYLDIGI